MPGNGQDGFDPQPQDLVLTLLGAYVKPSGERPVWSGGLVELLAEFGFSEGAARVALTRLVNRELLARVRDGRLVHYTLTPRTRAVLDDGDRRIFSLGKAARPADEWTVLWHAIPDQQRLARERLVRRLRFLGFGPVQDGTWMTPHDREQEVCAAIEELGVAQHVGVMLGRPAAKADFRGLLGRAWDLDALADRYRWFVTEFDGYRAPETHAGLSDQEVFRLRTRLVHAFRQFPFLDPELPADLVPTPEFRAEAVRLFDDLYDTLAPAAQRHFEEMTTP